MKQIGSQREENKNIMEFLKKIKDITLKIIDTLNGDDFSELTSLFSKRQMIINNFNSLDIKDCSERDLIDIKDLDRKLNDLYNMKFLEIKQEMKNLNKNFEAQKSYENNSKKIEGMINFRI